MKYEVVIPVFNGEQVIEKCLKSITEQEGALIGKDYSVLVVDDGSTDRTVEIASRFPVQVVRLEKNAGRIVARLAGARNARSERILFVDSRVTVPPDLMAGLESFDSHEAVMGVPQPRAIDKEPFTERIFFLVRRKYYGKQNYPLPDKDLLITPENFKRSPKGTTVLLIDRDLFIRLTPERTGKDVNDDSLLFHRLVYHEGIALLRTPKIKVGYDPERRFGSLLRWLYERGIRFADFYLSKGGHYNLYFRFFLVLAFLSLFTILFLPSSLLLLLLAIFLGGYLLGCVYLSEKIRDVVTLSLGLPFIILPFGAGVLKSRIKSFFNLLLV